MTTNRPTTTRQALALLIDAAHTMSAECAKAARSNRTRLGAKYEAANAQHSAACVYLQTHDRWAWRSITRDRDVSTRYAQELLDSDYATTDFAGAAFVAV